MRRWLTWAVLATVALGVALGAAEPHDRSVAVQAYLLFLAALVLLWLVDRTRAAEPSTAPTLLSRPEPRAVGEPAQLEELRRKLELARGSAFEVHYRLRPLVRTIAAARVARTYGIELEQAREVVGPALWELVRPDRQEPADRHARGLPPSELERLIADLEAI